jgi:DNA invertase Pin-like site-specific DNA recombinase
MASISQLRKLATAVDCHFFSMAFSNTLTCINMTIAKAKQAGKYKGKQNTIDRNIVWEHLDSGISIRKTAIKLSVSPVTVQKIKKERLETVSTEND